VLQPVKINKISTALNRSFDAVRKMGLFLIV
jgi:hypothetical protein